MGKLDKIILLLIGLSFVSCNSHVDIKYYYPNDSSISDTNGKLKDSLTFYYPTQFIHDSQTIKVDINTIELNWFSSALYCFNEPVLYNYYLGHDIYRFLWLRSFHRPAVITLNKDHDKVWLTTKMLDKEPVFIEMYSEEISPNGDTITSNEPVEKADRFAYIVYNQTKELTIKEWTRFESILDSCSFWTKPFKTIYQIDGAVWIIEGHLKNNYWFTNRGNGKAGRYLIQLSGLKEEIY
jgi:hypothetical protein